MSPQRHQAWIGLGSNLDGPREHVERAVDELDRLPLTRRVAASRLYASAPVGPADQPDYINAVALLETWLSPLALLDQLQALEQRHGRLRGRRWGPRTLDLDLLLFDDQRVKQPRLTLPHPEMVRRAFVLVPLAELSPSLTVDGHSLARLAAGLDTEDLRPVLPDN
ncbi:2-amino-4-hydroxy-6-hydroxymethyldihydropteridine diphosphokinase [Halomonas fontilapidosi]|uniref:2-amino-4-hydroxy-6-hydroxymethyldihydropteridine pyrophosphokinase n=1 Tax=Halomonas fontilapidosi TaxID=616675 RepID=A0A7W5DN48_9GAMM|nr:2-amino-4-hydroxy-6-hydroxymethyldihydropteridine diphosphokinase [Halomonas fontilapidosi]MBB3185529.1 2-amino-4-hydroxy-6-hydroxymethyldihydropteridine diphosphokinase [Halomonas fontilapidosi]